MSAESLKAPLHHGHLVRGLWRAARADRLPHALLFEGPAGVGKFLAARWFTLGLFCAEGVPDPDAGREGPCGVCPPCKRVLAGSHPDLFVLEPTPGEERYRLSSFVPAEGGPRSVQQFLGLRAAEGGRRVVLVREMERSRHSQNEVQNALLKMLEEPGQDVIWILETSRVEALLATIRSRCVPVHFERLEPAETAAVLAREGLEPERAALLARWGGAEGVVAVLRSVLRGSAAGPVAAARSIWELEGEFVGKTPRAAQRVRARFVLDLALDVLADQQRLRAGLPAEQLAHPEEFAPTAKRLFEHALRDALDTLLECRRDIDRNLDPQAVLDLAFCALGDLAAGPAREVVR